MSKIICLLGGSGRGKDAVKYNLPIPYVISYRTRPKRTGKMDGLHGYFVTENEYQKAKHQGKIIANTHYCGHYYWTEKQQFDPVFKTGVPIIYVVDGKGVACLEKVYGKQNIVSIWLDCSLSTLAQRMQNRGDSKNKIAIRLDYYLREASKDKELCDYVVDGNKDTWAVTNAVAFIIIKEVFSINAHAMLTKRGMEHAKK